MIMFLKHLLRANNQFAKTAAETVAENPGKQSFNPLIIYGGTGLGKTHLLHAIGNRVLETSSDKRIVIATSEKFTLDFVNGLEKKEPLSLQDNIEMPTSC